MIISLCTRSGNVYSRLTGLIQQQGCRDTTFTANYHGIASGIGASSKLHYFTRKRELSRLCNTQNSKKSFSVCDKRSMSVQRQHVDLKHFSKSMYPKMRNGMFTFAPESSPVVCYRIVSISSCLFKNGKSKSCLTQHTRNMSTDSNTFSFQKDKDEPDVSQHEDVKKWINELSNDFGFQNETVDQNISPSSDSESDSDDEKIIIVPRPVRPGEEPMDPDEIDKQMQRYDYEEFDLDQEEDEGIEENIKQHPCSFERGSTGVFEIEEVVAILEGDNAIDLCVISVPPEKKYVDYMVLATGKSTRHLRAMSAYIQWLYKKKRSEKDPFTVKIEGHDTKDWMAMDLGNIAVHLFLPETREKYDLETLWTVGPEFDDKMREEDGISMADDKFDWSSLLMEDSNKINDKNKS